MCLFCDITLCFISLLLVCLFVLLLICIFVSVVIFTLLLLLQHTTFVRCSTFFCWLMLFILLYWIILTTALRVHPAVTRLTVYRWLYVEYVLMIHLVKHIITFRKIWAEYGAVKGFGSWTVLFWTQTWWKMTIFQKFEKPFWNLRNHQKHTLGHMEKHRAFASEALIWLVER